MNSDHVFPPTDATLSVYESLAKPIVLKAVEGFNG